MAPAGEEGTNQTCRAGRIGCRGSASCSRPRGDGGGLCAVPPPHEEPLFRRGRVRQRQGSRCAKIRVANEAPTTLHSLAGLKGHPGDPANQVQKEVRARCLVLAPRWRPGADAPSSAEAALSASHRSFVTTVKATHWCPSSLTAGSLGGTSSSESTLHLPLRLQPAKASHNLKCFSPRGCDTHGPEAQSIYTCCAATVASCDVENCFHRLRTDCTSVSGSLLLAGKAPQALRQYIYVDDLASRFVGSTQVKLLTRFNAAGLRVHEVETHQYSTELLWVHLDLELHQTRIATHLAQARVDYVGSRWGLRKENSP